MTLIIVSDTETALQQAIDTAQSGDTIKFANPGTVALTTPLVINSANITIDGAVGGSDVVLQGNDTFTDIETNSGAQVTFTNLVITDGAGTGASGSQGTAAAPTGGSGQNAAGAIYNNGGTLTITNTTFAYDTATGGIGGDGYAVNAYSYNGVAAGGGGGGAGGSAAAAVFNASGSISFSNITYGPGLSAIGGYGGAGGSGAASYTLSYTPGGFGGAGGAPGSDGVDGTTTDYVAGSGLGGYGGHAAVTGPGLAWIAATAGTQGGTSTSPAGSGGGGGGGGGGVAFQTSGGVGIIPCFAEGTRLLTTEGDVAVEDLREGDLLIPARGGACEPVVWIGRRRVRTLAHPRPHDVNPVRIAAGAFGPGRPARALTLSPDHAVFAGGVLIPVRYLVNGATIVQTPVAAVTYYHVELARHDVVLAEGLPAETYLDTGNRSAFANGGAAAMAHPDFSARALDVWAARACAPLVMEGPALHGVRADLLSRALSCGHALTEHPSPWLLADGERVAPVSRQGTSWLFQLPRHLAHAPLRLVSRTAIPAETDPASDDRRRLGVAVAGLAVDGTPVPLEAIGDAPGWHRPEAGWRWTDGNALLPLAGADVLRVELLPLLRYWALPDDSERRSLAG
jgi:collagen type I alpha